MTSPFENAESSEIPRGCLVGTPVRLMGEEVRRVSRLEFSSIDKPEPVSIEVEPSPDGGEAILKEEVAALDGQLRSQAEGMAGEIERVRSEAKGEALLEWEAEFEERIARERSGLVKVCEEFGRERVRYFAAVEAEVVKLALAIAARVLHREAKLDPLLLAGVVRVALDKVAEGSTAVLRVPAREIEGWRASFADTQESSVQLIGDERLLAGECVIDTSVGNVELGVSAQLKEIENGFFDLLQQRPM